MGPRIGINPLTWTNDDMPELGGATPLETCLAEAREAGYEGIEMGNKFPRTAAELGPILDRHGLALVSGWYSANLVERTVEEEIVAVEEHLALMAAMGCSVMVFAEAGGSTHGDREAPISTRPMLADDDWAPYGERLTRMAEHLAARGVAMAFHHHMGTVIETEAEVDRLIACTGAAVGLLLDTGHMSFAGGDAVAVAARHGGRINHVHCKDVRARVLEKARGGDMSFLDAVLEGVFTVPGDGDVDFTAVLAALRLLAYSGWLVVEAEQDPAKAHPLTYARIGIEGVRSALAAAGL